MPPSSRNSHIQWGGYLPLQSVIPRTVQLLNPRAEYPMGFGCDCALEIPFLSALIESKQRIGYSTGKKKDRPTDGGRLASAATLASALTLIDLTAQNSALGSAGR